VGKVLLVVILLGVVIYLVVRYLDRRTGGRGGQSLPGPPRPVGPDDDPEFLWKLEKERRNRKKGKGQTDKGDGAG
jgi:hypothetical protein